MHEFTRSMTCGYDEVDATVDTIKNVLQREGVESNRTNLVGVSTTMMPGTTHLRVLVTCLFRPK